MKNAKILASVTRVDPTHPANRLVVAELAGARRSVRPVTPVAEAGDAYYQCGSHPEIVQRVWDELGKELPKEGRCLVYGRPSLVQPASGVMLAMAMGTSYALRIPQEALAAALKGGCEQSHKYGNGLVVDLAQEAGADWVFGAWLSAEVEWCHTVYHRFNVALASDTAMLTADTMPERSE